MTTDQSIDELRLEIDRLDGEILAAIKARTETSRTIGRIRRESGGGRIDPTREQAIYERYADLGDEGRELVNILLQLGRGKVDGVQ